MYRKADFYSKNGDDLICNICPHNCVLKPGQLSRCFSRKNVNGEMQLQNYGRVLIHKTEGIEKKTLLHFYPGSKIFSICANGCNLNCKFCRNYKISKEYKDIDTIESFTSENLLEIAKSEDSLGIAYTYTEPTIWYEYVLDTAKLFHMHNLKNVYISNGYINEGPLNSLLQYIDAFSITIKGYSDDIYKQATGSSMQPVLNNIKRIVESKKHLELVYLLVPELNDNEDGFRDVTEYISKIDTNIVLHIMQYFPSYEYDKPSTSKESMMKFYSIAKESLKNVYTLGLNIGLYGE